MFEQGGESLFALTGSRKSDLFFYAQKLWITLCINIHDGYLSPGTIAIFRYSLKKCTITNHRKNNEML